MDKDLQFTLEKFLQNKTIEISSQKVQLTDELIVQLIKLKKGIHYGVYLRNFQEFQFKTLKIGIT